MTKQTIELILLAAMLASFILYALGFEPEAIQAEQETITQTEALANNTVDVSKDNYKITHVYEDGNIEVCYIPTGEIIFLEVSELK